MADRSKSKQRNALSSLYVSYLKRHLLPHAWIQFISKICKPFARSPLDIMFLLKIKLTSSLKAFDEILFHKN